MEDFIFINYEPNIYTHILKSEIDQQIIYPSLIKEALGDSIEYLNIDNKDIVEIFLKNQGHVFNSSIAKSIPIQIPFTFGKYSGIDMDKIVVECVSLEILYHIIINDISYFDYDNHLSLTYFIEDIYQNIMDSIHSEILYRNKNYILAEVETEIYNLSKYLYSTFKHLKYRPILPYYWVNDKELIILGE